MADPKRHREGVPDGWVNARYIARTTGHRIQSVLQMLSSSKSQKREPVIWTKVVGKKWVDMPGGGREHRDVYEEYEAFPGLEWPYRPQTVTHEDFFRTGGSDDHCFPEAEGLDIIRRIRTWREANTLGVPNLPDGFFDKLDPAETPEEDPITPEAGSAEVSEPVEPTRDEQIVEAMTTYPTSFPRTKRQGWPYLRKLRQYAKVPDISTTDRKRLWPQVPQGETPA